MSSAADIEDRAQKIIDTAVELAEQGGFEAVRLRDVASQSGVALGTLYRHFRSKEDLLVAALHREADTLVEYVGNMPPKGSDPLERLANYFQAATMTLCRKPKLARAVLRAAASGVPELAEKLLLFHNICAELAVSALRGKQIGEEPPTELEMQISWILHQVWFGALIGWMSGISDQDKVVEEVRGAAELILQGSPVRW